MEARLAVSPFSGLESKTRGPRSRETGERGRDSTRGERADGNGHYNDKGLENWQAEEAPAGVETTKKPQSADLWFSLGLKDLAKRKGRDECGAWSTEPIFGA